MVKKAGKQGDKAPVIIRREEVVEGGHHATPFSCAVG